MSVVTASNGPELKIGSRVRCGSDLGTVTEVSDVDGDVDDEGRSYGIAPRVTVKFDDGTEESLTTEYSLTGWDAYMASGTGGAEEPWICEDVEAV